MNQSDEGNRIRRVNYYWIAGCVVVACLILFLHFFADLVIRRKFVYQNQSEINYTIINHSDTNLEGVTIEIIDYSEDENGREIPLVNITSLPAEKTVVGAVSFDKQKNQEAYICYQYNNQWKYIYAGEKFSPLFPIVMTIESVDVNGKLSGKIHIGDWWLDHELY